MFTKEEEEYLASIPLEKLAKIMPWDPKTKAVASAITDQIKSVDPGLPVLLIGGTALEIAGQNDLDLNVLTPSHKHKGYLPHFRNLFGEPTKVGQEIEWKFVRDGFEVELYLVDPDYGGFKRRLATFEPLRDNPQLRKQYEELKLACRGLPFREYKRRKFEFYHNVLGV